MLSIIADIATLILLGIGSYTDFKKREVPDWMSYSAIAFGLGLRAIYSIVTHSWLPLLSGAIGFGAFLLIALLMYYTGQWGGGDSKIIMGIGAIIGIEPTLTSVPFLAVFLVNLLLAGSIYGIIYTMILAFTHRQKFLRSFAKEHHRRRFVKWITYIISLLLITISLFVSDNLLRLMILMLAMVFLTMFYTWIFIKSIELSIMIKRVPIEALTEGDWIVDKTVIAGKYICGPKDLGIEKDQIAKLLALKRQKKIDTIRIKEGIPFVPGFLIAFIMTLILGNWLSILLI